MPSLQVACDHGAGGGGAPSRGGLAPSAVGQAAGSHRACGNAQAPGTAPGRLRVRGPSTASLLCTVSRPESRTGTQPVADRRLRPETGGKERRDKKRRGQERGYFVTGRSGDRGRPLLLRTSQRLPSPASPSPALSLPRSCGLALHLPSPTRTQGGTFGPCPAGLCGGLCSPGVPRWPSSPRGLSLYQLGCFPRRGHGQGPCPPGLTPLPSLHR